MSLINNNLSPLPFYENISEQNYRKDYAFGSIYPLITYRNMLLPFQYCISAQGLNDATVAKAYLVDYNKPSTNRVDITKSMFENGLITKSINNYFVIKYPGILPIPEIKHEGLFYLVMQLKNNKFIYSEVFTITNRTADYLELIYTNSYNFGLRNGVVDFSDNFYFKCYIPSQIGKPEYKFEEEVTERMGYSFIESQVSKKIYKFTFIAPEYLCDALRIVRLCNNKQITSQNKAYELTTFSLDVNWQEQGDLAAVECEFETDTVIANIGGFMPEPLGGDFNSDFNNDFDTK